MTNTTLPSSLARPATGIVALAVGSVLFTLGFACAVPLAAFAAISAMSFDRRVSLAAIGGVWLANQAWGFAFMHYPMDGETLAWGAVLGIIALLSCEAAGLSTRRISGAIGAFAAFVAAFLVYEGLLVAIDVVTGQSADNFAPATVVRIFLINVCAFGGLWALKAIFANTAAGRKQSAALAARNV